MNPANVNGIVKYPLIGLGFYTLIKLSINNNSIWASTVFKK